MSTPIKFAISGASIAGCATAIELSRTGFDVTVFERSKESLIGRGAGIVLPLDLIATLKQKDLLDQDFPSLPVKFRPILVADKPDNNERTLTTHPMHGGATNWQDLYSHLAKRVPEGMVQRGKTITHIKSGDKIQLTINDGEQQEFDYVIFADGYKSLGRKFLYPDLEPHYCGYIVWRGTLARMDQETAKRLMETAPYYMYEKGHLVMYAIPNVNAKNPQQDYIINWVLYETIEKDHPLFAADLNRAKENITKASITQKDKDYLHQLVKQYLPAFPRDIVIDTQQPFTQSVYDIDIPHYYKDNICLIGDASILIRPHVVSGSTKSLQDAMALVDDLQKEADVRTALKNWDKRQTESAHNLFKLSQTIGDLFVTNVPDWHKLTKQQMDKLWHKVIAGKHWYLADE
ncbi:MAG: hypothetical protein K0U12_06290 [Gammaproteobacteria bacterium]|nr:hypothetical protein [Gammaproteobacteria bacterium]